MDLEGKGPPNFWTISKKNGHCVAFTLTLILHNLADFLAITLKDISTLLISIIMTIWKKQKKTN